MLLVTVAESLPPDHNSTNGGIADLVAFMSFT